MFLDLNRLLGIDPRGGTVYQESSYGRRPRSLPGLLGEFHRKCVDLRPGETFTVAELEGPGVISRLWMTFPRRANPGALRKVVIRAFWDSEVQPSVLSPRGDLCGTSFSKPRNYSSGYLAVTSGAYLCFFPMPFLASALITLENQSSHPLRLLFYQVTWLKLDREHQEPLPRFHCWWHRERMARGAPPFTVLDAAGSGFYLGCHLDMEGRGWPWRPNPFHVQMPEGFGLGMLEGWERMWIDGAARPNVHGTGGEDYFNCAWYFTRVPSVSLTHGVLKRSYATRRVSCYRFHLEMPVAFRKSIRVTLDHGLDNRLPAVYEGTAYWYQVEPHRTLAELPPPDERGPSSPARGLLVMSAPLGLAASVHLLRRAVRRSR